TSGSAVPPRYKILSRSILLIYRRGLRSHSALVLERILYRLGTAEPEVRSSRPQTFSGNGRHVNQPACMVGEGPAPARSAPDKQVPGPEVRHVPTAVRLLGAHQPRRGHVAADGAGRRRPGAGRRPEPASHDEAAS